MAVSTQGSAVFLDRDGTLIRHVGYLRRVAQMACSRAIVPDIEVERIGATAVLIRADQSAPGNAIAGISTAADLCHAAQRIIDHRRVRRVGA